MKEVIIKLTADFKKIPHIPLCVWIFFYILAKLAPTFRIIESNQCLRIVCIY